MSSERRPTRDDSGREVLDALVGAGGLALLAKLGISFLPDSFPQKSILNDLVPWASGLTGAAIVWSWGKLHHRAARNDALEALLDTEEEIERLLMDPSVASADRQLLRAMLSRLKVYRAAGSLREAEAMREELLREFEEIRSRS